MLLYLTLHVYPQYNILPFFIQIMLWSLTLFLSKVFYITGLYILSNYAIFH